MAVSKTRGAPHQRSDETKTAAIVRHHFENDPDASRFSLEEQGSDDSTISRLLQKASKQSERGKGKGAPDKIIHSPEEPGMVIVIEEKADVKHHESADRTKPAAYAVDGVLHYAQYLSKSFDVIALAVSGSTASSLEVSAFRWRKGEAQYEEITDKVKRSPKLKSLEDYRRLRTFDPKIKKRRLEELLTYARELHNYMREYAKLSENEKPLIVSGVLLALKDKTFGQKKGYDDASPETLPDELYRTIEKVLKQLNIPAQKRRLILQPYDFLATHPELGKVPNGEHQTPLRKMIGDIDEQVSSFVQNYQDTDTLGHFYGEFVRYTGGDKQGLGIVLTPKHITELFTRLSDLQPTDTVLDPCCGSARFLITSLDVMTQKAGTDTELQEQIRKRHLIGVEQTPQMFALAASNMILNGDGQTNLYAGSCFDPAIVDAIQKAGIEHDRHARPNVGYLNPPYSQKGEGLHEFHFAKGMLDCLEPGATGIIIVPMSCAISPHSMKKEILDKHTLVAVMSMPDELFYPVSSIPCIMVFKAHEPHEEAPGATWFGYWKDDGFKKVKNQGRIDADHRWPEILEEWTDAFHNRREVPGKSVLKRVTDTDEWCVEAYMDTDYSTLSKADFEKVVRDYAVYTLSKAQLSADAPDTSEEE